MSRSGMMLSAIAFVAGMGLGAIYFGGLWLTVRRLPSTRFPVRWLVGSWLLRAIVALGGFYGLLREHWSYALTGVGGFWVARTLSFVLVQLPDEEPVESAYEGDLVMEGELAMEGDREY